MIKANLLCPDAVRQIITEEEIPRRGRIFPPDIVHDIFRYGAFIGSKIEHLGRLPRGMDLARQLIRQLLLFSRGPETHAATPQKRATPAFWSG